MVKVKNYTENEIRYIKNNFNNMTVKELSSTLNKEENSIYHVIRKLGLKKQIHSEWTEYEIDFLKSNYINMTSEEISKHINHTIDAINTMRDRLKLIRNSAWSDDEIKTLKNNFESMMFVDLSKMMNRTESALRKKCFELKLFKNNPWNEDEIKFVQNNYMEMPTSEISEQLNRTCDAIQLKAHCLGLKKYPYICDYHYFDIIDTEEKAYWLGFLSADGWINKSKTSNTGVIGIELQYGDIDHLKKFNKSISGNYQIKDKWKSCSLSKDQNKLNHVCIIRIFSMKMYESLINLGFSNNKSYDFHVPDLRQDLVRHYIRGYFDGDGCLTVTNKTFNVNFVTVSKTLNDDIVNILKSKDIKIAEYNYINNFDNITFVPRINRNADKIKFLDWIYKDSNIYLDRKYKKYLKAKKNNTNTLGLAV